MEDINPFIDGNLVILSVLHQREKVKRGVKLANSKVKVWKKKIREVLGLKMK